MRKLPPVTGFLAAAATPVPIASPLLVLQVLEYSRCSHPSANTHRYHAVASLTALQFAEQCCSELRTCASQWMPEGDRSTVDVDFSRVKAKCLDDSHGLRCEGLIQFN